jgi:aconitate hydratase
MGENLVRKPIADHLVEGEMEPGGEIALRVDQILTHDATRSSVRTHRDDH